MIMKRTILIKEVKYSNQAKILLGMTKMMQVTTKKMVREAALGKSPPAQNWMRILKKAASEATMEVQPVPESTAAHGW